ncbi:MAG: helix-turn-helix domain-containing protein, partial [Eubacterium sp.]
MARNKNPEITINRILDTSMDLFLKKGYDNTTIQDIVDALGDLSKGAIYHHFKSKEEIIEAVIPRLYDSSDNHLLEIKNSSSYT